MEKSQTYVIVFRSSNKIVITSLCSSLALNKKTEGTQPAFIRRTCTGDWTRYFHTGKDEESGRGAKDGPDISLGCQRWALFSTAYKTLLSWRFRIIYYTLKQFKEWLSNLWWSFTCSQQLCSQPRRPSRNKGRVRRESSFFLQVHNNHGHTLTDGLAPENTCWKPGESRER